MDYKEKYNKALAIARDFYNSTEYAKSNIEVMATYKAIFPELKESEDEKIRKELIFYFQEEIHQCSIQEHADKMKEFIAWLEKQGEQKPKELFGIPENSIENDVSVTSRMEHVPEKLKPIAKFVIDYAGWNLHKDEWNHPVPEVPLFRVLDALVQEGKPYQGCDSCIEQKPEWNEEDEKMYKAISIALSLKDAKGYLKSWYTTPEEADNWLKSLKDRVQPQLRQEWSEEDITYYEHVLNAVKVCYKDCGDKENPFRQTLINWLKSIRPQKQILYDAVRLVFEENLTPYKDGNQWCFLLGRDIQSGICGFGNTILDAAVEFYKEYDSYKGKIDEIQRPQKQWKPSKDQISALIIAQDTLSYENDHKSAKTIKELYEQLKAL